MQSIISSQKLTKEFQSYKKEPGFLGTLKSFVSRESIRKKAVDEFSFNIEEGEIIGLLGPNGAGKTTLMKMFTGIIVPSSGELSIMGHRPSDRDKQFRKNIALVMGQKSQLWWDIPAMDSFLLLQRFYEVSDADFEERIEEMSTLLGVKELLNVHVRKLSLGERMKMELMASLLHNPKVIFLDEPTIGLDLVAQENIRQFILDFHRKNNTTIIITSHYMADVNALCERLVLIFDGKKAFDGPISEFEKILGSEKNVSFTFDSSQDTAAEIWNDRDADWNENKTVVELRIPEESLREVSLEILKYLPVTEFNTEKMPIERVMKTLMENPEILRNCEGSGENMLCR
ncbi:MAG: ATP-binding cassette domain-containing protein [Halobacteriovoraceae bacterium]|jgi:ABC-2 type transport system ATP-binding protein|nr:ATP-binding cassette domain-containing protein [Halobacteriovoraceae bacterium]MBT5095777.1 ATP-binding cassette domain-containing protein [Halobacteriovoraceae bacterium]